MSEYEEHITIHETAFVTAAFRSRYVELSKDRYAYLWENEKTNLWLEDYLVQVSGEEAKTHALRNRFFLEHLEKLLRKNKIEVLINFGAGFSMYPFLLDAQLKHIEIDKVNVVQHKKTMLAKWFDDGTLPLREIAFIGVDFSTNYKDALLEQINKIVAGKTTFILIEGVLFFLNSNETKIIFELFETIQASKGYIGSCSFRGDIKETNAFRRLVEFFNEKVTKSSADDYQTIEDSFYSNLKSYELIDHMDYFQLSKKYSNTTYLNAGLILNEHMYLLKRI